MTKIRFLAIDEDDFPHVADSLEELVEELKSENCNPDHCDFYDLNYDTMFKVEMRAFRIEKAVRLPKKSTSK